MNLQILILNGVNKDKIFHLKKNSTIIIGRGDNCDLQIVDESVSRNHCSILVENDTLWIKDSSSINGVYVNNHRISADTKLSPNDLIQIGLIKLRLGDAADNSIVNHSTIDLASDSNILFRKTKQDPTFSQNFQTIKMHRDLLLLHKVSKLVYGCLNIHELLELLIKEVISELCAQRGCVVVLKDPPQLEKPINLFFSRERDSFSAEEFVLNKPILDNTILNGQGTISTEDTLVDESVSNKSSKQLKIRSTICVPLFGRASCLGALYLDSILTGNLFGENELDLLTAVGRQVGLAIERMFLEKKLIASAKHYKSVYQSIIEHASDVIYRHDQKGNFLIISPSIEKVLGYSFEEFLENPNIWESCVYEDDFENFYEKRNEVFQKKHCILKYRMVRKDEKVIWVEENRYLVIDENDVYVQGILRDITEKQKLEDQLQRAQRMEAMGLLAGGVAHDLNNILSGLMGYPDLLLMKLPPDSPLCKYLHGIKESAERASDVVNDLLALARRENYAMEPVPLNRMVNDYLSSLDFIAIKERYSNIEIDLDLNRNNIHVKGSLSHLIKCFMNLIINAMQAMPKGGSLSITTSKMVVSQPLLSSFEELKLGEYGVLKIQDTGEGITRQDIRKIFEPFYSKKIHKRGTGLGLAIVYGVIRDHHGFIDVQSDLGKGTTFTIFLPIATPYDKKIPTSSLDLTGSESILVVDDVPEQRELAKEFLSPLGYKVECVSSGEEAIKYLSKNYIDLIVLDMILEEGIDGLETYQAIVKIHPGQKAIIASGFANNERVQKVQALGAGPYLGKPYNRYQLSVAIRKELNRKKVNLF